MVCITVTLQLSYPQVSKCARDVNRQIFLSRPKTSKTPLCGKRWIYVLTVNGLADRHGEWGRRRNALARFGNVGGLHFSCTSVHLYSRWVT